MTVVQKIVKYLAICLAVFIFVTLITGIVKGIKIFSEFFNNSEEEDTKYSEVVDFHNDFKSLDINLQSSNLIIKNGDNFKVETTDKNIKIYNYENELKIIDKSKNIIIKKSQKTVITIPYNHDFEIVKIETGAGKVNIDGINTNILEMELGAGKTSLKNINSNKTSIETGVGSVNIVHSKLNDLNLELGMGKADIDADITGKSSIESGVGKLNLSLTSPLYEYTFELEKGIGEIKLNKKIIKNNSIIGEGNNYIKIEGGVGSINIKTSVKN